MVNFLNAYLERIIHVGWIIPKTNKKKREWNFKMKNLWDTLILMVKKIN